MNFNNIVKLWNAEFPFLKKYTDRTIYMVLKPFIIGLRFTKERYLTDKYRVFFEIMPLWSKSNSFLQHTIVSEELYTNKNCQIFISLNQQDKNLGIALERANQLYKKFFKENVCFNDFMQFICDLEKYLQNQRLRDWYISTTVLKLLLGVSIYYNNNSLYENAINYYEKHLKIWKKLQNRNKSQAHKITTYDNGRIVREVINYHTDAEIYTESNIEKFRHDIFNEFEDRNQFFYTIEKNCKLPKVAKLNVGEFIDIDKYEPPRSIWYKIRSTLMG